MVTICKENKKNKLEDFIFTTSLAKFAILCFSERTTAWLSPLFAKQSKESLRLLSLKHKIFNTSHLTLITLAD